MRAMILAAGLGSRLRPLSDTCPKPLFPLMLRPILGHLLEQLRHHGIGEVAINLHHQAAQIGQWLRAGPYGDMRLHLSYEPEILGTAGAIKQVDAFLREAPFWVINADVLADLDLQAVWQWHCERQALVTMVVRPDVAAQTYGPVWVDTADRVLQINGRPSRRHSISAQATVFTGLQIVSPEVLDRIPAGQVCSTTVDIYPALLAEQAAVYGYRYTGYWMDIGVPTRYLQAHWDVFDGGMGTQWLNRLPANAQALLTDRVPADCPASVTFNPPVVLGTGVQLAPGACVGPYAVLGAGCQVGRGTVIQRSVVWDHVHIAEGARIDQSVLGTGVRVAAGSCLHNAVQAL